MIKKLDIFMGKKTLTTMAMLAVFMVLLIVILGFGFFDKVAQQDGAADRNFIADFETGEIDKVILTLGEAETVLVKTDSDWTIETQDNIAADSSAVRILISEINFATIQSIASNDDSTKEAYSLDDSSRTKVELFKGDQKITAVLLGRSGSLAGTTFGTKEGDESIYLLSIAPYSFLVEDWSKPEEAGDQAANLEEDGGPEVIELPVTTADVTEE